METVYKTREVAQKELTALDGVLKHIEMEYIVTKSAFEQSARVRTFYNQQYGEAYARLKQLDTKPCKCGELGLDDQSELKQLRRFKNEMKDIMDSIIVYDINQTEQLQAMLIDIKSRYLND